MADRSLTSPSATLPRIEFSPLQALVDEPVIIRLTGFEAGQRVTLRTGEVIREYPNERPYPEYLFLGYPHGSDDPCYVVVACNDETVVVTVHDRDPEVYEPDHRTRR